MADMSDLLSGLLGDPENADKLRRIASMLGGMMGDAPPPPPACDPCEPEHRREGHGGREDKKERARSGRDRPDGHNKHEHPPCPPPPPPPPPTPCPDLCPAPDLDFGGGALDSAALLFKAMPILNEFAQGDHDPKVQLLYALRPYLTGERRERLEDAVLLLKLTRIAGSVMELFDGR